jgi:DNA invertase Pin-like site-specific DNA recombinase
MANGKYIAYYRVSTDRQGQSGLGLEAQRKAVEDYLNGGEWKLVDTFTEVESGKRSDRPQLAEALNACKRHKATLVIAKLDRLARNVHFVSGLMESGVEFVAADNPHANKLMVHMLAAFAEHERDQISQRTKAALAAAKARGVKLGQHGKVLAQKHRIEADQFAARIAPTLTDMKRKGMSVRTITKMLNEKAVPTAKGGKWHVPTTHRLLKRIERLTQKDAA